MIKIKSWPAYRSFMLLFVGIFLSTLCFTNTANAQQRRADWIGTIDAGTTINVRTTEYINTTSSDGRVFHGVVDQDVYGRNGGVIIPQGSDAELVVRRLSSRDLALDLDSVAVNGERFGLETSTATLSSEGREGIGANKRTGEYVGGGALLGAIIGGIAGGGKGAAIGAGAGAAAGAGAQILTRGGRISVPTESLLTFQLTQPVRAGIADVGYQRNGVHYHQGYNYAYERGLRDGRMDAQRNLPQNADARSFTNRQDRRDYLDGYNDGYENRTGYDYSRQKPGYYGGQWSISIGSHRDISWQAPREAMIYVQVDDRSPRLFASGENGTQGAPWMTPGHKYTFMLEDATGNEMARAVRDLR